MVHEITLDTSVLEAIEHPEYMEFMKTKGDPSVPYSLVNAARIIALGIFGDQDTIRTTWNEVVLWKPHYCGKKHEQPNSDRVASTCLKRNNPCCGHPAFSKLFQAYGLAGWLAKKKDPILAHPGKIIYHLTDIDYEGIHRYSIGSEDETGEASPEMIPVIEREIKLLERSNYENLTQPWIQRVSEILRGI